MSSGSSVSHSTRTRRDSIVSERKSLTDRRTTRALAHWRSRRDRGSTLAAQNMAASSLCGSGGLLLSWHAVRRIRLGAHATRDPQHRWRCDKRLPSRELDQNKRSGSERYGGQRSLPLTPPGLPTSRSGRCSIRSGLLADLDRSLEPSALRPVACCSRREQQPRSRSA